MKTIIPIILLLLMSFIGHGQSTELRSSQTPGKEYTDNQIDWLKIYLEAEVRSIKEAVDKVATQTAAKFEAQNEWRGQFRDQAGKFVTKSELWTAFVGLAGLFIAAMKYQNEKNKKINGF